MPRNDQQKPSSRPASRGEGDCPTPWHCDYEAQCTGACATSSKEKCLQRRLEARPTSTRPSTT